MDLWGEGESGRGVTGATGALRAGRRATMSRSILRLRKDSYKITQVSQGSGRGWPMGAGGELTGCLLWTRPPDWAAAG